MNQKTVSDYAEAMHSGERFMPIAVFRVEGHYLVADGFHKAAGALQAGVRKIAVVVREGDRRLGAMPIS